MYLSYCLLRLVCNIESHSGYVCVCVSNYYAEYNLYNVRKLNMEQNQIAKSQFMALLRVIFCMFSI